MSKKPTSAEWGQKLNHNEIGVDRQHKVFYIMNFNGKCDNS